MSMHFERATTDAGAYAEIELRTDTRLAAQVLATRGGITICIAEGFALVPFASTTEGGEIHIEIRERES